MKLSKKITAILFSALLCAALFAGCVKDTDSDTDAGAFVYNGRKANGGSERLCAAEL